jgi:hypothetical protein
MENYMKKIKIKFVDTPKPGINCFGEHFNLEKDGFLINSLRKNYDVEFSDQPDYIFTMAPLRGVRGWKFANYDCVRCQVLAENVKPDYNNYDFAISLFPNFHYGKRHLYFPAIMMTPKFWGDYERACEKHVVDSNILKIKDGFCSFVVSNHNGRVEREQFFHLLSKYKTVNSGGKLMNNIGGPVKDKYEFDLKHKFSITFENSLYYTTEKIVQAFAAKTIPIYWGNPDISEYFNPKAFINCHDYENFDKVIERIIKIDNNDELYMQMLKEPFMKDIITINEYEQQLDEFLVNMIETPREKAIQRDSSGWARKMQNEKVYGRKICYIMSESGYLLASIFRPLNKTKLGKKIKKWLLP